MTRFLAGLLLLALPGDDDAPNGDYGGFHTWPEILEKISTLQKSRPDLVHRASLGKTWEGRDIPLLKISDHAERDEDEPELLLMAGIHPREQQPQIAIIRLLEDLVGRYGRDERISRLVDEREIWIVPVLNVDGKVYDMKHGNGRDRGASWRKNRRATGGGAVGVDLNRNLPVRWGGMEDDQKSIVYEGPEPLSEPETRALARFFDERPLRAFVDLHSTMKAILHPSHLAGPEAERYGRLARLMRDGQRSPYRLTEIEADVDPPAKRGGNTGLTNAWGYYTRGAYSFIFEVGGRGFYQKAEECHAEYEENVREPLLRLIEACGDIPLPSRGAARLAAGRADRKIEPGTRVSWTPEVAGWCDWGVLVGESPLVQVTSEFRLFPPRRGFDFQVSREAEPGAKVPMVLYLWDRDRALSVERFTLTIE